MLDAGQVVHRGRRTDLVADPELTRELLRRRVRREAEVSAVILLVVTGLGLGALYFLVASGLSLIYGLMGVLNFAHGAFMMAGAYADWLTMRGSPGSSVGRLPVAWLGGRGRCAHRAVVEVVLIRPLYRHHIQQVLVTVGLVAGGRRAGPRRSGARTRTRWRSLRGWPETTEVAGALIPNDRFLFIAAAGLVFAGLKALLRFTRFGLVIRAGVENRTMVEALGINVRSTFTVVFAIGGAAAAWPVCSAASTPAASRPARVGAC